MEQAKVMKVTDLSQNGKADVYIILDHVLYIKEERNPQGFNGAEEHIFMSNGYCIDTSKLDAQRVLSGIEGTITERADDITL